MSNLNPSTGNPIALSGPATVKFLGASVAFVIMVAVAGYVGLDSSRRPVARARPALPAHAQNSSGDMARCEQLYTTWSDRYANDGSPALGANRSAELAIADCERGDFSGGNAELEHLFRREGMNIPSAQTGSARSLRP